MPKGYPTPKTPAPAGDPAPMIFVEPLPDSAIRINAYGLDNGQVIDALRRTLLHLLATQSGVQIISLDVPPQAAIVRATTPPLRVPRGKPDFGGLPSQDDQ